MCLKGRVIERRGWEGEVRKGEREREFAWTDLLLKSP